MKLGLPLSLVVLAAMMDTALYAGNNAGGATGFDSSPKQHTHIRTEHDVTATKAVHQCRIPSTGQLRIPPLDRYLPKIETACAVEGSG
jgi:hypothetical protein